MSKIKGTAVDKFGYTGVITLSQYRHGKKFTVTKTHNRGGKPLFDFLAYCLAGDFTLAKLEIPTKILLLYVDDENNISRAGEIKFITISEIEKVPSIDNEGVVKYSCIIPQEYFSGTDFNAIGLYTESARLEDIADYAALGILDEDDIKSVSLSSVLVLDWELHISNEL